MDDNVISAGKLPGTDDPADVAFYMYQKALAARDRKTGRYSEPNAVANAGQQSRQANTSDNAPMLGQRRE